MVWASSKAHAYSCKWWCSVIAVTVHSIDFHITNILRLSMKINTHKHCHVNVAVTEISWLVMLHITHIYQYLVLSPSKYIEDSTSHLLQVSMAMGLTVSRSNEHWFLAGKNEISVDNSPVSHLLSSHGRCLVLRRRLQKMRVVGLLSHHMEESCP